MKAQELRIGNLVNYKYWNPNPKNPNWEYGVVKIVGVVRDSFYFTKLNKNSICRIGELHPIPLTEEWLVKFGLLNNDIGIWNNGDAIYLQYGSDHDKGIELLYVHQLQNLYFALTGEELSFEQ